MAISKQFLKSKPVCKVTFELPAEQVNNAEEVAVLGSFNNWNPAANLLKKQKNGLFKTTIELPVGESFEFRYLVDKTNWLNDEAADAYQPSGLSSEENGVLNLAV